MRLRGDQQPAGCLEGRPVTALWLCPMMRQERGGEGRGGAKLEILEIVILFNLVIHLQHYHESQPKPDCCIILDKKLGPK